MGGALIEELVVQERIHSFKGADLAILCKLMSQNESPLTESFWPAMRERFLSEGLELALRDFMTICNAFKVAHKIDDLAFVTHAESKMQQMPE